jgi:hypothetical protein
MSECEYYDGNKKGKGWLCYAQPEGPNGYPLCNIKACPIKDCEFRERQDRDEREE